MRTTALGVERLLRLCLSSLALPPATLNEHALLPETLLPLGDQQSQCAASTTCHQAEYNHCISTIPFASPKMVAAGCLVWLTNQYVCTVALATNRNHDMSTACTICVADIGAVCSLSTMSTSSYESDNSTRLLGDSLHLH